MTTVGEESSTLITARQLNGAWTACADEGVRSELYEYSFTAEEGDEGQWRYTERRYGEGACLGAPSMTLRSSGSFTLGMSYEGFRAIDMISSTLRITPENDTAATLLNSICSQSFSAGEETDVSMEGCERLNLPSLSACPVLYTIVGIEVNDLLLGEVSDNADLCMETQRPSVLEGRYMRR